MKEVSLADFIRNEIDNSDLSQKELAQMVGFNSPNIITMIKLGNSKLAINRIPKLAKALNIDPAVLLDKAYTEYDPETYAAIIEVLGKPITVVERDILRVVNELLPFDSIESDMEREIYIQRLETVLKNIKRILQVCGDHSSAAIASSDSRSS